MKITSLKLIHHSLIQKYKLIVESISSNILVSLVNLKYVKDLTSGNHKESEFTITFELYINHLKSMKMESFSYKSMMFSDSIWYEALTLFLNST